MPAAADVGIAAGVWAMYELPWLDTGSLWRFLTDTAAVDADGEGEDDTSGDEDIGLDPTYVDGPAEEPGAAEVCVDKEVGDTTVEGLETAAKEITGAEMIGDAAAVGLIDVSVEVVEQDSESIGWAARDMEL